LIRRIGATARFFVVSACLGSLTACPSAAPEGTPDDGGGGESASTGTSTSASSSNGGTPTSSGGSPTSSASTASGQGGDGGSSSTSSQSSAGGDEGGGPPGAGGDGGGTGGDASSNGSGGAGGDTAGSGGGGGAPCGGVDLTTDDDNCGECGHSCLGGECEGSACQPVTLAEVGYAGVLVLDDTHVWFVDQGNLSTPAVLRAPKDPAEGPATTFTDEDVGEYTQSIVLTDNFVVWSDFSENVVTMSPRATAAPEILTEELSAPEGMAAVGDDVFVAASGNTDPCIARIAVGTGALDRFPADPQGPSLVVADDTFLYYVEASYYQDSTADIVRVGQNGSGRMVLVQGNLPNTADDTPVPTDLALFNGTLYFANARGVFRLPADAVGTVTPERLVDGNSLRVAADASGLYFFTSQSNALIHADFEGNALDTVTNARVNHIALDDDAVYWTQNNDPLEENPGGRLMKLAK
jgi:hypothetical protein